MVILANLQLTLSKANYYHLIFHLVQKKLQKTQKFNPQSFSK